MTKYLRIFAILTVALLVGTPSASAAELDGPDSIAVTIVNVINDSSRVTIEQPQSLNKRLERVEKAENGGDGDGNEGKVGIRCGGYRVEVFADNNVRTAKVAASNRKRQLQARLPQYRVYMVFESPFWRVRLGDFTSRSEAESALAEVRRAMPGLRSGLRIVRSQINPR